MQFLACGSNAKGQLALGDDEDRSSFTSCSFLENSSSSSQSLVTKDFDLISAAFGANHTVIIAETSTAGGGKNLIRTVLGAGDGGNGQLGALPSSTPASSSLLQFRKLHIPKLLSGASLKKMTPVEVAACWETTYIVYTPQNTDSREDDILVCLGGNNFGCLGATPSTSFLAAPVASFAAAIQASGLIPKSAKPRKPIIRIKSISTGLYHVIAYLVLEFSKGDERGVIVGWGWKRHGQLELHEHIPGSQSNASSSSNTPIPPSSSKPLIRRSNGQSSSVSTPKHIYTLPKGSKVKSMSAGSHHSVVLIQSQDEQTTFFIGGSNEKNQLAVFDEVDWTARIPRQVGCTWNGTYILCDNGNGVSNMEISASGSGERGQLGRSQTSTQFAVQFPSNFTVENERILDATLSCGSEHVLLSVIKSSQEGGNEEKRSEIWGWGWNEHGNLGLQHTENATLPARLWPPVGDASIPTLDGTEGSNVSVTWAGNGTSWIGLSRR